MTNDNNTSHGARKGLFDSIAGKAKEVAGALSGKNRLTREGQLQQAGAHARRAASSDAAIAKAEAQQAVDAMRQGERRAAADRRAADTEAVQQQQAVGQVAATERASAEVAAQSAERSGHAKATVAATQDVRETIAHAQSVRSAADATELAAQREHDRLLSAADAEERRAAGLRADAETL